MLALLFGIPLEFSFKQKQRDVFASMLLLLLLLMLYKTNSTGLQAKIVLVGYYNIFDYKNEENFCAMSLRILEF